MLKYISFAANTTNCSNAVPFLLCHNILSVPLYAKQILLYHPGISPVPKETDTVKKGLHKSEVLFYAQNSPQSLSDTVLFTARAVKAAHKAVRTAKIMLWGCFTILP